MKTFFEPYQRQNHSSLILLLGTPQHIDFIDRMDRRLEDIGEQVPGKKYLIDPAYFKPWSKP